MKNTFTFEEVEKLIGDYHDEKSDNIPSQGPTPKEWLNNLESLNNSVELFNKHIENMSEQELDVKLSKYDSSKYSEFAKTKSGEIWTSISYINESDTNKFIKMINHDDNDDKIEKLRSWLRLNGILSENGTSITYSTKDLETAIINIIKNDI